MPRSDVYAFFARALNEIGYDEEADSLFPEPLHLFVKYPEVHAVVLADDPHLTTEDAVRTLALRGVDMRALFKAIEELELSG